MIDFRSDTVSKPTPAMRAAMADAEVGDDVFGDDPTVRRLQDAAAELLGKEAGLFVTSGTQSNLCSLLAHCARGDEYLVGDRAHMYRWEGGGGAVLGSIQPQPVPMLPTGMLDLDRVEAEVKPDDPHFARSRLLCIENTHDGKVIPLADLDAGADVATRHGLDYHLDGARMWNASVALGVSPAEVAARFDSVSVCLSKGLGAPVGSVLVGSTALIAEARKWRKMLGGGLRQVGIVAAAGLHALENNIERLADDHANAISLAEGLADLGAEVGATTNMVFADFGDVLAASSLNSGAELVETLEQHGVQLYGGQFGSSFRLVTHIGVSHDDVSTALGVFRKVLAP